MRGHDELRLAIRRVVEEFALGLHEDIARVAQLEPVEAARVRAIRLHCNTPDIDTYSALVSTDGHRHVQRAGQHTPDTDTYSALVITTQPQTHTAHGS